MARDSSGNYSAPSNSFNPAVNGATISETDWNATLADIETEMTDSLSRSGKGGMSAVLDMNGYKVQEVGTPSASTDAATKGYVDTAVADYLPLAGGTMTGAIAMGTAKITGLGDPTSAQDAATKTYVDTNFTYTAGSGLDLSTLEFSVDFTTVAALASPALTGNPTAPTQSTGDNSTKIATTAYVAQEIAAADTGWQFIGAETVTATSSYDLTSDLSGYTHIRILFKLQASTANQDLQMRLSTDGGSTFLSTSGDYKNRSNVDGTEWTIYTGAQWDSPRYLNGSTVLWNLASASNVTVSESTADPDTSVVANFSILQRGAATAEDAVRLISGDNFSGTVYVFGM